MAKKTFQDLIVSLLPSDEVEQYFSCCTEYLPKTIYPLSHKDTNNQIKDTLAKNGRILKKPTNIYPSSVYSVERAKEEKSLGSHFLHEAGFFYVQEQAASLPAQVIQPQAGDCILDLCSAPGGKTVQMADILLASDHPGLVVANEPDPTRRQALISNLKRTGLRNTMVTGYDGTRFGEIAYEMFDKVLVDAPCSGEGMLYKTKQIPSMWQEGNVHKLSSLQEKLLRSALLACKPGGIVVYSTCTLNTHENEEVVERLVNEYAGYIEIIPTGLTGVSGEKYARCRPHRQQTGGFFIAKIRKLKSIPVQKSSSGQQKITRTPPPQAKGRKFDGGCTQQTREILATDFGATLPLLSIAVQDENTVSLTSTYAQDMYQVLGADKIGVPLFKKGKQGYRTPLDYLAISLGSRATVSFMELSDEQAQSYVDGKQLSCGTLPVTTASFVLLRWHGQGIACIKVSKIAQQENNE